MHSSNVRLYIFIGVVITLLLGWWLTSGDDSESDLANASGKIRLQAISTLEQQGDEKAVNIISQYTQDRDIHVARRSIQALGRMQNHETDTKIKSALADKRYEIREAAVVALGDRVDKPENVAILRARLADPREDANVRIAAAPALVGARDWDALPALINMLNDPDRRVRRVAIGSIQQMLGRRYPHRYNPSNDFPVSKRLEFMAYLRSVSKSSDLRKMNDAYKEYRNNIQKR
jgi:hypothetical protein